MEEHVSDNDPFDIDWAQMEEFVAPEGADLSSLPTIITPGILARRLLWDVVPCPRASVVSDMLNLPKASEDVLDMEHEECHARLAALTPLLPLVLAMSTHSVNAIVATIYDKHGMGDAPEHVRADSVNKLVPVVYQSAWAIIAELVDVGALELQEHQTVVS